MTTQLEEATLELKLKEIDKWLADAAKGKPEYNAVIKERLMMLAKMAKR